MANKIVNFSELRTSCSSCNLYELCLPRGLSRVDVEKLDHVVKNTNKLGKGDYLFRENDPFSAFYAVRSGSVKSFILNENGEEQIIGFYFPGEILGFDAMENEQHTCYTMALETASFCALPYNKLHEICLQFPDLQKQMFRLMGKEFSNDNKMLLTINNRTAEERIATFLFSLSTRFKKLGYSANRFNLTMSRMDIANYLGLKTETVSRLFTKMQRDELITINKKEVIIKKLPDLKSMCEAGNHDLKQNNVS